VEGFCTPEAALDACQQALLVEDLGPQVGDSAEAPASAEASCGDGALGREVVYRLVAAEAGALCLDTAGSDVDTVLHVRRADCGDPQAEVACNDDAEEEREDLSSQIDLQVEAGVEYFIFVDTFDEGEGGAFVVDIRPGPCDQGPPPGLCDGPDDCPGGVCLNGICTYDGGADACETPPREILQFGAYLGDTVEAAAVQGAACGAGARGREAVFGLEFEEDTQVCLTTVTSAIDTVLHVRTDCDDPETEVACNDDHADGDTSSGLTLDAAAAQHYSIFVDAFGIDEGGDYALTVIPGACPACFVDAQCDDGAACVFGECVFPPQCAADADCPQPGICTEDGACEIAADAFEENDIEADAADLAPGLYDVSSEVGDDDWYEVSVCPGGTLTVTIEFDGDTSDLDLALLDQDGEEVDSSALFGDVEEVVGDGEADGRDLLVVVNNFGDADNLYSINVDLECPLPVLVINEIDYDQPGDDLNDFVEIYNAGDFAADLTEVRLELVNGANGSVYGDYPLVAALPVLPVGGYLLATNAPIGGILVPVLPIDTVQNGANDGVRIVIGAAEDAVTLDGVSYEGVLAGVTEGNIGAGEDDADPGSLARCPNGVDTGDNDADFANVDQPTPGVANVCPDDPEPALIIEVEIMNFDFDPAELLVPLGATVRWTNQDAVMHTVTSGAPGDADAGSVFDSPLLGNGDTFEHTFDELAEYTYFCRPHSGFMSGYTIEVIDFGLE